jgi:SSS family solute:Na+ symporter
VITSTDNRALSKALLFHPSRSGFNGRDIYRPFFNSKGSDHHYVNMGRWTTVIGVLISVGTTYLVMQFASIMDYVQALFSFFIAPLFGTVVLGMLWKRATGPAGFWGLLCGTLSSVSMWS